MAGKIPDFDDLKTTYEYIEVMKDNPEATYDSAIEALQKKGLDISRSTLLRALSCVKVWRTGNVDDPEEIFKKENGKQKRTSFGDWLDETLWPIIGPYWEAAKAPDQVPGMRPGARHVHVTVGTENMFARLFFPRIVDEFRHIPG